MFQSFSDTIVRVISDVFKFGESDHMDCTPTAQSPGAVYGYGGLLTEQLKVKAFTDIRTFSCL